MIQLSKFYVLQHLLFNQDRIDTENFPGKIPCTIWSPVSHNGNFLAFLRKTNL